MPKKPYKFDAQKKADFLEAIANGNGIGEAANSVGISRQTVYDHEKDDEAFTLAIRQARDSANEKVENALFEAALSGNVTACQVWLYNRCPERWADRRNVALTGRDGGPIEGVVRVKVVMPDNGRVIKNGKPGMGSARDEVLDATRKRRRQKT